MSVSGPSPLGTLMVQRVEAALGATLGQLANVATGARPDAVTPPGQPDKVDPAQNPPPKEHQGARQANEQGGRQAGLAALTRNDPEIAKLLAARNAPMTGYTASAPTTLGQAAKTILALLQLLPQPRPAIMGRTPLLGYPPSQGATGGAGSLAGSLSTAGQSTAAPAGGSLDPRAIEAPMQRANGGGSPQTTNTGSSTTPTAGNATDTARSGGPKMPPAGHITLGQPGMGISLPTGMVGLLALALSRALQGSGLFYESHLRDLAFGRRDAAQLRAEPQAQAGQEASKGDTALARPSTGQNPQTTTQPGQPSQTVHQSSATQQQIGTATPQSSAHLTGALLGLDPATHVLVRQQLETLANQSVTWQGEAWPGTEMEWEVQRREPEEANPDETETWATRLKLQLPGLGEVQARLSLSGSQLIMHLVSSEGASLMADHTDMLRQRLNLQGLLLSQLTISREDDDAAGATR